MTSVLSEPHIVPGRDVCSKKCDRNEGREKGKLIPVAVKPEGRKERDFGCSDSPIRS